MTVSENFIEYVLDQLSNWDGISKRKMFGGLALYRYGQIFSFVADDIVYLKVNEITKEKFLDAGSKPFKPFPNRPIIESYYELPANIIEDPDKFIEWAEESLSIKKNEYNSF